RLVGGGDHGERGRDTRADPRRHLLLGLADGGRGPGLGPDRNPLRLLPRLLRLRPHRRRHQVTTAGRLPATLKNWVGALAPARILPARMRLVEDCRGRGRGRADRASASGSTQRGGGGAGWVTVGGRRAPFPERGGGKPSARRDPGRRGPAHACRVVPAPPPRARPAPPPRRYRPAEETKAESMPSAQMRRAVIARRRASRPRA